MGSLVPEVYVLLHWGCRWKFLIWTMKVYKNTYHIGSLVPEVYVLLHWGCRWKFLIWTMKVYKNTYHMGSLVPEVYVLLHWGYRWEFPHLKERSHNYNVVCFVVCWNEVKVSRTNSIWIHHECAGKIEKSVPRTTDWQHEACQMMTNGDHEGWIFISHSHTNNRFFFFLTIKYRILCLRKAPRSSWICWDAPCYDDVTLT